MSSISTADVRRIFEFLARASDIDAGNPLPRPVLKHLATLIPSDLVEYFEMRRSDRAGLAYNTNWDVEEPQELVDHAEERGGKWDNPIGAFRWHPADGPLRLSTTVSPRALHQSEYYNGWLRPMGIRDQLKVWLWSSDATAACVSLDRHTGTFSDRDVAVLGALQEHLIAMRAASLAAVELEALDCDARLTTREVQVLTWAGAGRDNREIGELLFISPDTVRKHLENAYTKLGVRGRAKAFAMLVGLTPRVRPIDHEEVSRA